MRFLTFVLALVLAGSPASACQWEFAPEPIGGPSAAFIAPRMATQATFVDIALAEGASEISLPPGVRRGASQALSFRVIKRLKGHSADRFILFGGLGNAKPGGEWGMTHWVDKEGRIYPHRGLSEGTPALPESMTSCDPPGLTVAAGRLYVVLREADGRLLGSVPYHPGLDAAGTAIALAGEAEPDDFTRQLLMVLDSTVRNRLPEPAAAPESGRAILVLRRPLVLKEAQALLQITGAQPFGALLKRGNTTTDYRLGSEYAFPRLLDDAINYTAKASTAPQLSKALAGRIVDQVPAASFDDYDPTQGVASGIVALGRSVEQGTPAFLTIDVIADPVAQATFARHPNVLRVEPARRIRRAITAGTLPPYQAPELDRATIYPQLTRLAGRGFSPNALDGEWKVTGSFEPFKKVPVTLRLRGGNAEASSDCFAPARGSYRLDGLILTLALAKPDLSQCAKTQEYWSLDYLFGDKSFTVRLDGDQMRLQGSAGSDFSLERGQGFSGVGATRG